jgi:hypothetical protein
MPHQQLGEVGMQICTRHLLMISTETSTNVYANELRNMVESRAIRQAEYKALTSSYQTGGRRYATSKDQRLPKLHKVITRRRYKARGEICGALGRLQYCNTPTFVTMIKRGLVMKT